MKKLKHEKELLHEAINVGAIYFEKRGAGKFEPDDHADTKVRAIYALLVRDKLIHPLARDDENVLNMRHKLAIWMEKNLPDSHPLKE
ncbi:MAG: DUF5062 family protein [Pseudohongiellaceae bacterium]